MTFKSTLRKQISNFQVELKKYDDTLNVAKNNIDLLHFNINNTSTSSTALIKKKYRSRFLSNVVRLLILIFNTSAVTSVFFEQHIVDFFLLTQKTSKTSNHSSVLDLFEKNTSNFIILLNFNFSSFEIIQRNIQNKSLSIFIFSTLSTTSNFIFEFFIIKLNSKKRRELFFENFILKFRRFSFENQQFVNQKQTSINFESQSNIRKTIVEKTIYRQSQSFQSNMFANINSVVQIVIDKFMKTMFQRFKSLMNKQRSSSIIESAFTTNVDSNQFTIKFSFKKLKFFDYKYEKKTTTKNEFIENTIEKTIYKNFYIFVNRARDFIRIFETKIVKNNFFRCLKKKRFNLTHLSAVKHEKKIAHHERRH